MPPDVLNDVEQYTRDCERLRLAVEHALDDLRWTVEAGGKVVYAVDFSEVFAYAVPDETAAAFQLFELQQQTTEAAHFAQEIALSHLFYGTEPNPVLLIPYRLSLQERIVRWREDAAAQAGTWFANYESIPRDEAFRQAQRAAEAVLRNEVVDESDRAVLAAFVERHGGWLLAALNGSDAVPLHRVRRLVEDGRLAPTGELARISVEPEPTTQRRWESRLAEVKRSRWENRLDAMAVAFLAAANQLLRIHKTRLVLVTRSGTMHRIFAEELEAGLWDSGDGHLLRHPWTFHVFATVKGLRPNEQIDRLSQREQALTEFIADAGSRVGTVPATPERRELADLMRQFREDALETDHLAATLGATSSQVASSRLRLDTVMQELRPICAALVNDQATRSALAQRLEERSAELVDDHRLLAGMLNLLGDGNTGAVQVSAGHHEDQQGITLRAWLQQRPYAVELTTETAVQLLDELRVEQGGDFRWERFVPFFIRICRHTSRAQRYEGLLAMAFLDCAMGRWDSAERYCEAARAAAGLVGDGESVHPHEALFLQAVCKRKRGATTDQLVTGVSLLEEAIRVRRASGATDGGEDPRYLVELGVQVLRLSEAAMLGGAVAAFSEARGLELLRRADQLSDDIPELRIIAANNALYHQVSGLRTATSPSLLTPLRNEMRRLCGLLEQHFGAWERWPSYVMHTVAYAEAKLHGRSTRRLPVSEMFETVVRRLQSEPDAVPDDVRVVRQHFAEFKRLQHA
jgi:hypothetical protein